MQKIDFVNAQEPAINDTNLNLMQTYIEAAINAQVSGDTLPVGCIVPFTSDTVPENWLLCDGQTVSRTEYDLLFSIIGTSYGVGDGSTTFNLPDLRGRVAVGKDSTQTEFDSLGETGGEKTHTLTIDEMPSHSHAPANGTDIFMGIGSGTNANITVGGGSLTQVTIGNTGGGQPHNILQPYQVTNYIIKAKQSSGLVATVVDSLNSTSTKDALSANQGKVLKETTPRLIYEKVITANDINGFTTTDFSFELGKSYKILVVGSLAGEGSNIYNLRVDMNDTTPTGARNVLFGSENGEIVNTFTETKYLRFARGFLGYGLQAEMLVTYFVGSGGTAWIRTTGHYSCTTTTTGVSTNIETMIGPYTGNINKFTFSVTEGKQITEGTTIKIFELP